jgi:cell division protein ZapA (FtsZ GTPase activity inhibitor)
MALVGKGRSPSVPSGASTGLPAGPAAIAPNKASAKAAGNAPGNVLGRAPSPRVPTSVTIGGHKYSVASSADPQELHALAAAVDAKLIEISGGRPRASLPPQALVLAALAFANDIETLRRERAAFEARTRDILRRALAGIDEVMEAPAFEAILHELQSAAASSVQSGQQHGNDSDLALELHE